MQSMLPQGTFTRSIGGTTSGQGFSRSRHIRSPAQKRRPVWPTAAFKYSESSCSERFIGPLRAVKPPGAPPDVGTEKQSDTGTKHTRNVNSNTSNGHTTSTTTPTTLEATLSPNDTVQIPSTPTDDPPEAPVPTPPPPDPVRPPPKKQSSFSGVLAHKIMDTGDDILMHLTRWGHSDSIERADGWFVKGDDGMDTFVSTKPIILVLGFGWAAHSLSKVVDIEKYCVLIVSPRNHFLFTPMLPATAVGSVEFRSLLEPVRMSNPFITYFEAEATSINIAKQRAICESVKVVKSSNPLKTFCVPYDYLVLGVGEMPATFGTPGVRENCFFMKEVRDSVAIRNRISTQFEEAEFIYDEDQLRQVLRFVVVGGGPTGVEFAGTLSDFLFSEVLKLYPRLKPYAEVVLVQAAKHILPVFDSALQQQAEKNLEQLDVRIMTDVRVTAVRETEMYLSNGEALPYGVCLWSAGNCSRQITRNIFAQVPGQQPYKAAREAQQKVAVDNYLRVVGTKNVFAAGDCARIVEGPLPPTAQVAGQQGAYIARVINRNCSLGAGGLDEDPPYKTVEANKAREFDNEFEFLSLGIMAYIGRERAIMQVDMDVNVDIWGKFAFLLWRSVYITKQVSMRNRVLILFDWLKTRVFGRDVSLF